MLDVRACGMGGKHVDETKARGHVRLSLDTLRMRVGQAETAMSQANQECTFAKAAQSNADLNARKAQRMLEEAVMKANDDVLAMRTQKQVRKLKTGESDGRNVANACLPHAAWGNHQT